MRSFHLSVFVLLIMSSTVSAQTPGAQNPTALPPAPPILSKALCGAGTFLISLSGTSVGREAFDVKCREDGYSATAQTSINFPGAAIDVQSQIDVNKNAIPTSFSSKGKMATTTVDQKIEFKNGKATITTENGSQEMLYQDGASFIMSNVPYLFMFIVARYDVSRSGPQEIALFPNITITVERTARDAVQPVGTTAGPTPTSFDRYTLKLGPTTSVIWADMRGRVAMISVPLQKFVSVRQEYSNFVEPLHSALASLIKSLKPDYSVPASALFTAEEVKIKVKGYVLAGTLLIPKTGAPPFPVVVTVTGSGQQTRDEPLPFLNLSEFKPFRQIAEHLASRGIAVLRVDDRGVGDSTGIETLEQATTFDFADDVRAQVAYLRTRRELDPKRIAIMGHSEGGIIAPLVASSDPQIAAIVLLAGTAKRGDEVLLYQMNRAIDLNMALTDEEKIKERAKNQKIIRTVLDGGDTSNLPTIFHYKWTKVFLSYDPLATIKKVRQPIFIIQGGLDRQVTADQAGMLAKAAEEAGNTQVMVRIFPDLNHLLLPAKTGEGSEYSTLEVTSLGDELLRTIGDWLLFKLQRSEPAAPKR